MRLLILTPRFPYPTEKGDKLRMFYQIKELAKYNDVILVAITEEEIEPQNFEVVKEYCEEIYLLKRSKVLIFKNLILSFFRNLPFQVGYYFDKNLQKQLTKIIEKEKANHLYCQLFRTAEYIRKFPISKTIDYQDTFSMIAKKWAKNSWFLKRLFLNWEARKVAKYEEEIFHDFDNHTIISQQDLKDLEFEEKSEIQIIPNGVDTEFFQPMDITKKYDLAFIGNMGYPPNVAAAVYLVREILPIVQRKYPKIKVLIAGARPAAEVRNLAERNVTVSGWVEDIRVAYAESKIFVAPIFMGGGLQNKVLESMAMGVPIIYTTQVHSGINDEEKNAAKIADSPNKFAEGIFELLDNEKLYNELIMNGLSLVKEKFSWEKTGRDLQSIFESNTKKDRHRSQSVNNEF